MTVNSSGSGNVTFADGTYYELKVAPESIQLAHSTPSTYEADFEDESYSFSMGVRKVEWKFDGIPIANTQLSFLPFLEALEYWSKEDTLVSLTVPDSAGSNLALTPKHANLPNATCIPATNFEQTTGRIISFGIKGFTKSQLMCYIVFRFSNSSA